MRLRPVEVDARPSRGQAAKACLVAREQARRAASRRTRRSRPRPVLPWRGVIVERARKNHPRLTRRLTAAKQARAMAFSYAHRPGASAKRRKRRGGLLSRRARSLLLAWVMRSFIFAPFSIPSGSMLPALYIGDYVMVAKWPYGFSRYSFPSGFPSFSGRIFGNLPERGDIVVFRARATTRISSSASSDFRATQSRSRAGCSSSTAGRSRGAGRRFRNADFGQQPVPRRRAARCR